MSDRVFVDTNVLVYAYDLDVGRKCEIAGSLLRDFWENRSGHSKYPGVTRILRKRYAQDLCTYLGPRNKGHREYLCRLASGDHLPR